MELNNKRSIIKLLDSLLMPLNFARIKDDWYLDNQECVSVIGLGKSFYGGQFTISIALFLKVISPKLLPHPPFHLCNFKQSIEFIVSNSSELKAALDLENSMSSTDKINIITTAVTRVAVPTIMRLKSKEVIAHEIKINDNFEPYCDLELKLVLEQSGYLSRKDLKLDF